MTVLYSEIEPYPTQWLRNLIEAKHIAEGIVVGDIKEIEKVEATQFHAFAGIGVWSHALRLARWPDDVPVWTGSCPCQPFSVAGKGKGIKDERHLWPDWFRLIRKCQPPVLFGEQVVSPAGRTWLNSVFSDLESVGYVVAGADLPSAGVGAPHRRQRLYFVAQKTSELGDSGHAGLPQRPRQEDRSGTIRNEGAPVAAPGLVNGFWADAEWIQCTDGKQRPVKSGTHPLAYGITNRVGRLRAYRNAITPQIAATFIRAVIEG